MNALITVNIVVNNVVLVNKPTLGILILQYYKTGFTLSELMLTVCHRTFSAQYSHLTVQLRVCAEKMSGDTTYRSYKQRRTSTSSSLTTTA